MQKAPVVVIGLGEMGSVFARGLLRLGHPVFPVVRSTDIHALAAQLPEPARRGQGMVAARTELLEQSAGV